MSMTQSPLIEILQPISAPGVSGEIGFQMREIPFKTHLNLRGDPKDPKFLSLRVFFVGDQPSAGTKWGGRELRLAGLLARPG
jgi:hypothetical protein